MLKKSPSFMSCVGIMFSPLGEPIRCSLDRGSDSFLDYRVHVETGSRYHHDCTKNERGAISLYPIHTYMLKGQLFFSVLTHHEALPLKQVDAVNERCTFRAVYLEKILYEKKTPLLSQAAVLRK